MRWESLLLLSPAARRGVCVGSGRKEPSCKTSNADNGRASLVPDSLRSAAAGLALGGGMLMLALSECVTTCSASSENPFRPLGECTLEPDKSEYEVDRDLEPRASGVGGDVEWGDWGESLLGSEAVVVSLEGSSVLWMSSLLLSATALRPLVLRYKGDDMVFIMPTKVSCRGSDINSI